jgi:hypothetical protein
VQTPFRGEADIEHIGRGLVDRTLPKSEWTHAAHFAAAFWLLSASETAALQRMPGLIRAYNEATGVANSDSSGYHETITQASLRAASSWLAAHAGMPRYQALNALLQSEYGQSAWLFRYWSRDVLFSVTARRTWVPPDLQPLPFPRYP